MKVTKKNIAVGMLALGLATTAGAGITVASEDGEPNRKKGGNDSELSVNLLGITTEEFKARVQAGEKPREMLEAAGFSKDDMRTAYQQQMKERIAQSVEKGRMTQEQADEKMTKLAERKEAHDASHVAIENNDYDAWEVAVAGGPRFDQVDMATFSKLVEAYNLRELGDHEGAQEIMNEISLK